MMSHQMEFEFAKVCYADKPDTERDRLQSRLVCLDSSPAPQPMIFATRNFAMTITITAFEQSPDGGKGLARDTRVRWALEEVGQPYDVRLLSFSEMKEPAHR